MAVRNHVSASTFPIVHTSRYFRTVPPSFETKSDLYSLIQIVSTVIHRNHGLRNAVATGLITKDECVSEATIAVLKILKNPNLLDTVINFDRYLCKSIKYAIMGLIVNRKKQYYHEKADVLPSDRSKRAAALAQTKQRVEDTVFTRIFLSELAAWVNDGHNLTSRRAAILAIIIADEQGQLVGTIPKSKNHLRYRLRATLREYLAGIEAEVAEV